MSESFERAWGAFVDKGPVDWQIYQQNEKGHALISMSGRWAPKESMGLAGGATGGMVQVRLVREATGFPVAENLDWQNTSTAMDGTWKCDVGPVPAGGLYRLETRFNPKGNKLGEWSLRGDTRHFLGVGDIWVIAGQSNASGYGRNSYHDESELGIHVLRQSGIWSLASHPLQDSTSTIFNGSRETHNAGHGPFLHFARRLKQEMNYPIGLIVASLGGSALELWNPEVGPLFKNMMTMISHAGGKFKGMVWYQGETDAKQNLAHDYLKRFLFSVKGWRDQFSQGAFPVLSVQLSRYYSVNSGNDDEAWSLVREAQRQAAYEVENLSVIPTLDLPLDDTIHLGSTANIILAERLVQCALGLAYHKLARHRAPEIESAKKENDQIVTLIFSNVFSRLESMQSLLTPFVIEDEMGRANILKTVYSNQNTVKLFVEKTLGRKVSVSGGVGENPPTLPIDVERQMPILAFYKYPVL